MNKEKENSYTIVVSDAIAKHNYHILLCPILYSMVYHMTPPNRKYSCKDEFILLYSLGKLIFRKTRFKHILSPK